MYRVLIVEGEEDQKFFSRLIRAIGLEVHVRNRGASPGPVNLIEVESKGGKTHAIPLFASELRNLSVVDDTRVGLVVDADHQHVNAVDGFANTQNSINQQLASCGFGLLTGRPGTAGFFATAGTKPKAKVGAWIMPDNSSDGCLEDFVCSVVHDDESARYNFAANVAKQVADKAHSGPEFKFRSHHLPKAQLGTWLAWSDPPRMSFANAIKENLLDQQKPPFQDLMQWLRLLYL